MAGDAPCVYVAFPSATVEKARAACDAWRARGYRSAVFLNEGLSGSGADLEMTGAPYPGYWGSCNRLARRAVELGAEIVVLAADDMDPDPKLAAAEIGRQFLERFPDGFGVMQPCGDPQGRNLLGFGKPAAARICGSPWVGRAWIRRAYRGRGPCDDRYFHFFGDNSLHDVATKLKVLWMRPDLAQFHRHWLWGHQEKTDYQKRNDKHWATDEERWKKDKAAGYPDGEPLP